jgi:hypothetical protein
MVFLAILAVTGLSLRATPFSSLRAKRSKSLSPTEIASSHLAPRKDTRQIAKPVLKRK